MMQYEKLTLVSHHLCPYVQRTAITLMEKNIAFERIYVDLSSKPDWFLKLSPLGKVPLLQVDDRHVLFESAVICEFVDEVTPSSLHPTDPVQKARHRAWIEFGSQMLNDIARLYNANGERALLECALTIQAKAQRLEDVVGKPFFAGDVFTLVDAAYGPIFRYFDTMETYLPLDVFAPCPKLQAWRNALSARPSVRAAVTADYPARLKEFLLRRDSALSHRLYVDAA